MPLLRSIVSRFSGSLTPFQQLNALEAVCDLSGSSCSLSSNCLASQLVAIEKWLEVKALTASEYAVIDSLGLITCFI